ncbi:F0F1 ATP synthase subunit B [uncultured Pseudokineococcus sp.]|uniref:F0F1 ATP synthase subunit B n=1 Tax=uncultured Pseudokineococcus sp. TaxID=1642928 RepID=UPI0026066F3D|nr:F0F1 ATP synthase subunit B [uncultured Pseudokineococcus sp.]
MTSPVLAAAASEGSEGWWSGVAYPIIPHPGEIIIGLIAFSILYVVMAKFVVPRFEQTFEERREAIEGGMEKAERAQAEAERTLAEYKQQLAEAREEAGRIREEARAQGAQILEEMRQRAESEAQRVTESAQRQIASERQQAMLSLRGEVGGLATELASRIVGESLADEARQSRVVDRFLEDLERGERESMPLGGTGGGSHPVGDPDAGGGVLGFLKRGRS